MILQNFCFFDANKHFIHGFNNLCIQTRYGEIKDVFLDGAKGEGEKDMDYLFQSWFSLIHQLQPGSTIFGDSGPDVRWVGNEAGIGGSTSWSSFNRSLSKIGGPVDPE